VCYRDRCSWKVYVKDGIITWETQQIDYPSVGPDYKFLTAVDLGDGGEGAAWRTVLIDGRTGEPVVPNGSLGFRYGESGVGRWNLELGGMAPSWACSAAPPPNPWRCCCPASTARATSPGPVTATARGRAGCCGAGCRRGGWAARCASRCSI
jgi:hypothetical protein